MLQPHTARCGFHARVASNGLQILNLAERTAAAPASTGKSSGTIGKLNPKGKIELRFADRTCSCILKELNLKEMITVIKREDWLPAVLQMVSVDIEEKTPNELSASMDFYTGYNLQKTVSTRAFFNLNIRFVDNDPKKMEFLNHFIQAAQS